VSDHGSVESGSHTAQVQQHGHDQPPPRIFRLADELFEQAERILVYLVGLFLIGFAAFSLFNTLVMIQRPIFVDHDYTQAISIGFDSAFLTIILLEVLHTVLTRSSLARQIREFLVIGITSAVRHSLEVAAAGSDTHQQLQRVCVTVSDLAHHLVRSCPLVAVDVPISSSEEVVIELAINAGGVLLLVVAFWLVGQGKDDGAGAF
jgi:hypothetical protein